MVQWFRVNLFRENQIVGVASRSGQTCQPQKGKKYEILKPRARKSSDNWVKSRQMLKISQWKDIFWNWAGYLLIHLHLTWKQTLRFQHFLEFDFLRKREKSVANLQEREIRHEIMRLTTKSWDLASLSGRTKPITVYDNEYRDWFVVLIIQCTCDLREYGFY